MESQYQKWVNLSYLAVAILLGYVVFSLGTKFVSIYDLEVTIHNVDLVLRGFSVLCAAGLFLGLYRNDQVNQFMNEVMVELSRVTWPTQKVTTSSTVVVLIMVILSGVLLGVMDYLWTAVLKLVI